MQFSPNVRILINFGLAALGVIVAGGVSIFPDYIPPGIAKEIVQTAGEEAIGKQLFDLLKCQQCHVLGAIPKEQPTANLAPAAVLARSAQPTSGRPHKE